jgi:hypothetical protein
LTASDQAIERVLNNNRSSRDQKTEALSLMARNAKTRWRQTFEGLPDLAQRRKAAANRQLLDACDGYLKAYSGNLNHYWSGLAGLQMGAIAKSLAQEDTWEDAFDSAQDAVDKKDDLTRAFDDMKGAVKMAVQQARTNPSTDGNARIWAGISNADWLFLNEPKDTRVRRAYTDSVPSPPWFLDAVKGQLGLFAGLGVRADLANAIIADLTAAADPQPAHFQPADLQPASIVIVAGHRIDEPGRSKVRFPESAVPAVRERLREKLAALNQRVGGVRVMASAAPGTDILCHELCQTDLALKTTMCLPMPVDSYSRETFKDLDGWRSRFLSLVAARIPCLQLSDVPGLPRWLQGTGTNEWERGNRWVLQLALSAAAPKVSLIAVLDETQPSEGLGGTAHMVQLARAAGRVDVDVIKLKDGGILTQAA